MFVLVVSLRSSTRRRQEPPSRQNSGATPFPAQPFRPSMPCVWHAAHQRVSHIGGLHLCVTSPPRHDALAAAHHPRALACALRLQPHCAQSAPLASPHLPPPLAQVMVLGSLTTFSLAFSTPVPRLPSSSTQGLRFDRARVLLLSAAWAWARHGLEVYGRQLVCCSCLGVLIRSVNQVRTVGPTTHARGPRPGPDPHPWADLLPLHLHDCKHRLTHPATGHTRARRPRLPLQLPYSRPAPPQSSPISRPTHRRRPRRRSPWLALHRSAEATAGA